MTLRARLVLDDCRLALQELHAADTAALFRVRYAACCALLRTVGYVLQKVDAATSKPVHNRIASAWERWNDQKSEHALFWEFIDNERHRILKEYEPGFVYGEHMVLADDGREEALMPYILAPDLYVPLSDGTYAGEDVRDLIQAAIEWWELELGAIDTT